MFGTPCNYQLTYLILAGRLIIPNKSHVHAAPNGRMFILRPTEHLAFHGILTWRCCSNQYYYYKQASSK